MRHFEHASSGQYASVKRMYQRLAVQAESVCRRKKKGTGPKKGTAASKYMDGMECVVAMSCIRLRDVACARVRTSHSPAGAPRPGIAVHDQ